MADGYSTSNYRKQGGDEWQIDGTINMGPGGKLQFDGVPMSGPVRAGAHTVTAAEVTATQVDVDTGLSNVLSRMVQILRANAVVTADAGISEANGTLTIVAGAVTYVLTENDEIHWIAVGS